jgi:hypothetical protein
VRGRDIVPAVAGQLAKGLGGIDVVDDEDPAQKAGVRTVGGHGCSPRESRAS